MWLSPAGCWICVTVFRRLDEGPCFRNSTVRLGGQRDQLPFFFLENSVCYFEVLDVLQGSCATWIEFDLIKWSPSDYGLTDMG
ncbi:hypothetical protein HanRHA438_Chr10g0464061 [Helianthus annuus]|nr:hypothetical protein HanHA89_Chr10g0393071 [Helianthus annuus]KAJ0880518.1 hypothetical protein HanRHA438_Chr10g0464061 [Helianthus annuus]KAJ0884587.1 hypothetical protein HanPSC8_Chr10g0435491 [Helianthus annuus]